LSILLPNLPQIFRDQRSRWNRRTLLLLAVAAIVVIAFVWFFSWSRATVFSLQGK
jgi:hypothetical protein